MNSFKKPPINLDGLTIQTTDNKTLSFQQALDSTKIDGMIVIYQGKIVHEKYFAYTDKDT